MPTKMRGRWPTKVKHDKRSDFEERVHKYLLKKGIEHDYEGEVLAYTVPEKKHKYLPDFSIANTPVIIEAKGRFDPDDRRKMLLLKEQHPDREFRMLFMRNNKLTKHSNTTYGAWCDKHGFKWHVDKEGRIPPEWVKDLKGETTND
jgi:hypothetical protein